MPVAATVAVHMAAMAVAVAVTAIVRLLDNRSGCRTLHTDRTTSRRCRLGPRRQCSEAERHDGSGNDLAPSLHSDLLLVVVRRDDSQTLDRNEIRRGRRLHRRPRLQMRASGAI